MTAEPIANVIADIRQGRAQNILAAAEAHNWPGVIKGAGKVVWEEALMRARLDQPVIDATPLYEELKAPGKVRLYEDFPSVMSPWENATICFVNDYGNVVALQITAVPWPSMGMDKWRATTINEVDWDRVKWFVETFIWVGHRSEGKPIPTVGPLHMFQMAIYEDGSPADLHYVALMPRSREDADNWEQAQVKYDRDWEMSQVVLLSALNFLNCKNVEIVEPVRERHLRKRIARTGVTVQHITVRPISGRHHSRRDAGQELAGAQPLTHVRGHFAHYGPQYNKGLLFGKFAGKYWIPQFARGAGDDPGQPHYTLKPARKAS